MATTGSSAVGLDRMRSAMRAIDDRNQTLHMELGSSLVMLKLVAEDLEADNNTEAVKELEKATRDVIALLNEFECHNKALQSLSEGYSIESEHTNFERLLADRTDQFKAENPVQPEQHPFFKQFQEAIWKVHHAGEPMPGQEREDLVITCSQYTVVNTHCPISGKPVVELDDPVRSSDCGHIYDRKTVLDHIKKRKSKRPCLCAAAGCPKVLVAERLICDPMLKVEIQDLRMRGQKSTQIHDVADYTELDD